MKNYAVCSVHRMRSIISSPCVFAVYDFSLVKSFMDRSQRPILQREEWSNVFTVDAVDVLVVMEVERYAFDLLYLIIHCSRKRDRRRRKMMKCVSVLNFFVQ